MSGNEEERRDDKNVNESSDIYSLRGDYYFLSNFYECQIEYQGICYQNAEAAFQAQKCLNEEDKMSFCGLPAAKAKRHGRRVLLRPDWESVKFGIMEEVVRAKFNQNPQLAESLLATGGRQIVEGNTWGDTCWGVDTRSGKGANHLGQILMRIREELSAKEQSK